MMDQSYSVDCLGGAKNRYRYAVAGRYIGQPSLATQPRLCEKCNENQAVKIQEMNSFECDFQGELDLYKQKMDEKYQLCQSCEIIVSRHLKTQAADLRTFLLDSHLQQSKSTSTKLFKRSTSPWLISLMLAQLTCAILASMLVCSEFRTDGHFTCGESIRLQNSSHVISSTFLSLLTSSNVTYSTAKQMLLHLPGHVRAAVTSLSTRGLEVIICLSSLTKGRYLHISLVCLLLNILTFLKRKTRFGILTLLSWAFLSVLRCWELFWWKAECRWRFTGATLCSFFSSTLFLFSLLSYSRVLGKQRKRRYKFSPRESTPEKYHTTDWEAMETDSECTPPNYKATTELDYNLNGLSLGGLPAERRNGFRKHSSLGNSLRTGSFWNQSVITNDKDLPLVSMQQRPLIVPATLHFSGLRPTSSTHTQGAITVTRPVGVHSFTNSSDDDASSDSMGDELPNKSLKKCTDKQSSPSKSSKRIKRSSTPSTTRVKSFMNARTLLLISSLLLNVYFAILYTEWPVQILYSLLNIFYETMARLRR